MVKSKRLDLLERAAQAHSATANPSAWVVIYDLATGQPLEPIPDSAHFQVWLPDNGLAHNGA